MHPVNPLGRLAIALLLSVLLAATLAACGGGDPEPVSPALLRRRTLEAPAPTATIHAGAAVRAISGQVAPWPASLVYAEVQGDGTVLVYGAQPDGNLAGPIIADLGDATSGFAKGQATTLGADGLGSVAATLDLEAGTIAGFAAHSAAAAGR
jgi:hypothetical protein